MSTISQSGLICYLQYFQILIRKNKMKNIFLFILITNIFLYADLLKITENRNNIPSIQWIQSDGYNMLCTQVYQSAKNNIDKLDSNSSFSAMLEQKQIKNLPSAIVTDIDETILSTLKYQEELLEKREAFSSKSWEKYIALNSATPISASLEYFSYLSKRGIHVIYISNRTIISKDHTFKLLKKLGYPITRDKLLLKNEKTEWTRNKATRRSYIANKYRVIQLFGDHLTDFAETNEEALTHKDKFGTSWFLLPNPIYGTWLKKYK